MSMWLVLAFIQKAHKPVTDHGVDTQTQPSQEESTNKIDDMCNTA